MESRTTALHSSLPHSLWYSFTSLLLLTQGNHTSSACQQTHKDVLRLAQMPAARDTSGGTRAQSTSGQSSEIPDSEGTVETFLGDHYLEGI